MARNTLICDIETYPNYYLVAFMRVGDGKVRVFEETADGSRTYDREQLRKILMQNTTITYNGQSFDMPIIFKGLDGGTVHDCKRACDLIINGNIKYWQAEEVLGTTIPRALDHIDLIEVQPNAWASLKTLNGRLHGKKMQDLPYPPDQDLTPQQIDEVRDYCVNDLEATLLLYEALAEPLRLREALSEQYETDFLSKSDAQIGEGIIKRRIKKLTGDWPTKAPIQPGTTFPFRVPEWLRFKGEEMRGILERLSTAEFFVKANGYVDLPDWLAKRHITIGETTYAMGIGGLHSTERNRMVAADDKHFLRDYDVASYYPAIILGSGLYPKACGPEFLDVYREIRDERITAKKRVKEIDREIAELEATLTVKEAGDVE